MAEAPRRARTLAVIAVTALLTSCTGSGGPRPSASNQPTSPFHEHAGNIVIGAGDWHACIDPLSCAMYPTTGGPWAWYTVLQQVLPRAMEIGPDGNWRASMLLAEAPSFANGGLQPGPPFRIAFHLNPKAVWEDGSPITSRDFQFTWHMIEARRDEWGLDRYRWITALDASSSTTVVLTLKGPMADWPQLFGGPFGCVLKAAAFKGLTPTSPRGLGLLLDKLPFSGGPFILRSWASSGAVLTRNETYWGPRAHLDQVTFVRANELRRVGTGELSAEAFDPTIDPEAATTPLPATAPVRVLRTPTPTLEALWFNVTKPPLNDPRVREALMFAVSRRSLLKAFIGLFLPSAPVVSCGLIALPGSPICNVTPFDGFSYDPARARSILKRAGYECSRLPCTRKGRPLQVMFRIANAREFHVYRLIRRMAGHAGFVIQPFVSDGTYESPSYATPLGEFPVASTTDLNSVLGCQARVSPKNPNGRNVIEWCNREADRLIEQIDAEFDPVKRVELFDRLVRLEVQDHIGLPLYQPLIEVAWRTDQLAGPIGVYAGSPNGPFYNLSEWHRAG